MSNTLIQKALNKHSKSVGYIFKEDCLFLKGISRKDSKFIDPKYYLEMFGLLDSDSVELFECDFNRGYHPFPDNTSVPYSDPNLFAKIEKHHRKYRAAYKKHLEQLLITRKNDINTLKSILKKM